MLPCTYASWCLLPGSRAAGDPVAQEDIPAQRARGRGRARGGFFATPAKEAVAMAGGTPGAIAGPGAVNVSEPIGLRVQYATPSAVISGAGPHEVPGSAFFKGGTTAAVIYALDAAELPVPQRLRVV